MTRALFAREARAEFLGQIAYYQSVQKGLGSRFRAEVEAAAKLSDGILIHAVAGDQQLPEYWLSRVQGDAG